LTSHTTPPSLYTPSLTTLFRSRQGNGIGQILNFIRQSSAIERIIKWATPTNHLRLTGRAMQGTAEAAPEAMAVASTSVGTGASGDRKSTRLNSSHVKISYAVFG